MGTNSQSYTYFFGKIPDNDFHQWYFLSLLRYEPGETYDSKFSSLSSAIEECRAECVGIYLCNLPLVLEQFNLNTNCSTDSVPDVVYVNWLSMVRSGVTSMEFYSPAENAGDIGSWRQAHCCARYVILRVSVFRKFCKLH